MSSAFGGATHRRCRGFTLLQIVLFLAVSIGICHADTASFTGTLSSPEDTVLIDFTLNVPGTVILQTYGFGGGTDAAGTTIPAGGFDPFVGLFALPGAGPLFAAGTSDILSTYSPGCPPAGTVTIGSVPGQCGDVNLVIPGLPTGTYAVLLSDGEYSRMPSSSHRLLFSQMASPI